MAEKLNAYQTGKRDRLDARPIIACPFYPGTSDAMAYRSGWNEADAYGYAPKVAVPPKGRPAAFYQWRG